MNSLIQLKKYQCNAYGMHQNHQLKHKLYWHVALITNKKNT